MIAGINYKFLVGNQTFEEHTQEDLTDIYKFYMTQLNIKYRKKCVDEVKSIIRTWRNVIKN